MSSEVGKGFANALSKWYLNQNLLTLIASLIALYYGEKCNLCVLTYLGCILSIVFGILVIITMIAYTFEYCMRKCYKAKRLKLDHKKRARCYSDRSKSCCTICEQSAKRSMSNCDSQLTI